MTSRGILIGLAAAALAAPAPAGAAFDTCVYDAGARTVTASLTTADDGGVYVDAGGAIVSGTVAGGGTPCGAATTANTDRIEIEGRETLDSLGVTVDNSGPGGAFRKALSDNEIAIAVDLGEIPWTYDPPDGDIRTVRLIGTTGADQMRAGLEGGVREVNIDAQSDADADVALDHVGKLDLDGGDGNDYITGLGGTGTRDEYRGALVLRGGDGDDRIVGNSEPNLIYPGAGGDDVDGGGPGAECLPCGGLDIVSYEDAPGHVEIAYPHQYGNNDGFGFQDYLDHVEGIRGSNHDDVLTNSGVPGIMLDGAGGDDEILGGFQADVLYGGDGDDQLRADPYASFQTDSSDQLSGGAGDDLLVGGQDPDVLRGGPGDDILNAGRIESTNYEFSMRNTLDGGSGSDRLNGAQGNDSYVFNPPVGNEVDTIHELSGEGRDKILAAPTEFQPPVDNTIDLSTPTRVLGTGGTRTFRVANLGEAANLEDVETGFGDDHVTGNAAVNRIATGAGEDVVRTRDAVADTVDCGPDWSTDGPDTAIADKLDELTSCETVDRTPPPAGPKVLRLVYARSAFKATLPGVCVSPTARPRLHVKRTYVGSWHARLVRVAFLLDGHRLSWDGTPPFGVRLPAGLSAGDHALELRLRLKRPHHEPVTRTLRAVVKVCAAG